MTPPEKATIINPYREDIGEAGDHMSDDEEVEDEEGGEEEEEEISEEEEWEEEEFSDF